MADEQQAVPNSEPTPAAAADLSSAQPAEPAAPAEPDASSTPAEPAAAAPDPVTDASATADPSGDFDSANSQADIDELLKQATFDDVAQPAGAGPDTSPFELPSFHQVMADAQASSIDLLRDVELNVKIELGRSRMLVEDVLKLAEGSVVELDKLAGDPVDVFVNDRLVARGEVLVLNDNFCVRVNEIVAGAKEEGL
jgi:flagellar motor switch protein FliN/FliY